MEVVRSLSGDFLACWRYLIQRIDYFIKLFADDFLGKGRFYPPFVDDNQPPSFLEVKQLDRGRKGGFISFTK